jgi:hypothetical protein
MYITILMNHTSNHDISDINLIEKVMIIIMTDQPSSGATESLIKIYTSFVRPFIQNAFISPLLILSWVYSSVWLQELDTPQNVNTESKHLNIKAIERSCVFLTKNIKQTLM